MSRLGQLYFGRDGAESDIESAKGGLLRAGFLKTAAYDAALSGKKLLIIGRKGSGKSAICMTLVTAAGDSHVASLVTPDQMSHDEIRRFQLQGVTDEMSKSLFWRYLLTLQIAKHVVTHNQAEHKKSTPKSVKTLAAFLADNGETADPRKHEQFWRSIQRLRSLSLGAFGANMKVDLDAPSEGLRTSNQLHLVERTLKTALADLACPPEHSDLLLLIDQLESVWSNDPESDAMVTGLLMAAKHVTGQFLRVRCVVFIRTDIYDSLPFAEKDKFRGEEMRIEWTPERLQDLVLARAQASVGTALTAQELWEDLFPAEVRTESSGDYLVSRTLMRPRDLIQFANACRDAAEKNGHDAVTVADVDEAEVQFSQWKLQDLASEYGINYPFLAELYVLFQSTGYIVSRQILSDRFATCQETLRRRFPEHEPSLTLQAVIDILYGIGFLGVQRRGKTVYSYEDPALVDPGECRFYLHPCFRQAMRSTTATDLHPYSGPEQFRPGPFMGRSGLVPMRSSLVRSVTSTSRVVAERIDALLADKSLPPETAREIHQVVETLGSEIENFAGLQVHTNDEFVDLNSYVRWVCGLLQDTAHQLGQSGVADDPVVHRIARTMEDEARRLAAEANIRL